MSDQETSRTGHEAGERSGRFCPTCRSAMVYTGTLRGDSEQQRCSSCGFTAWKRAIFTDSPADHQR